MAKVILKGVEKQYPNGFKAVHGIDLDIKDGEFMVFVGPSGCAKSTTLRMIAGLEEITGGTITIGDKVVNDVAPKDRGIAMVFQNYALYPHMNVYDNMGFGLKLKKVSKEIIDVKVKDAAEKLGLTELLYRKPKEMSGGQRQRVAVGRAIVREPGVFLFDEPLSNLDAKLRVHMRVKITQLHQELGTTMIYVTHDQVEAMTMGDRICVLEFGKIKQVDTPLNLYHRPQNKFVAGFIGSPSMNIVEAKILKEGTDLYIKTENMKLRLPESKASKVQAYAGKDIWFGLRPDDIASYETNPTEKDNYIEAKVFVVEQMGSEVNVYFSPGKNQYIATLHPESKVNSGDIYKLWFDMDKCHIFDKETEENVSL